MDKKTEIKIKIVWHLSLILGSISHCMSSKYLQMTYLRISTAALSICILSLGLANLARYNFFLQLLNLLIALAGIITVYKSPTINRNTAGKYGGLIVLDIFYIFLLEFSNQEIV